MFKQITNTFFLLLLLIAETVAQQSLQQLSPVSYAQVQITDSFWVGKMHRVATNTIKACVDYTENKTGR